jgi:hypothetical protein
MFLLYGAVGLLVWWLYRQSTREPERRESLWRGCGDLR